MHLKGYNYLGTISKVFYSKLLLKILAKKTRLSFHGIIHFSFPIKVIILPAASPCHENIPHGM